MALSHEHKRWGNAAAAALLLCGAPLAAQTAPATTSAPLSTGTAPPSPPPVENDVVGPATLRDFNLNGTVTRRAEPPSTAPTAAPTPAFTPVPVRTAPDRSVAPSTDRPAAPIDVPTASGPRLETSPAPPPLERSVPSVESPADPGFAAGAAAAAPVAPPNVASDVGGGGPWAWILAALALVAGAVFTARQRAQGSARYGAAQAGAGTGADVPLPQSLASPPDARPLPKPPAAVPARPVPAIAARRIPVSAPRAAAAKIVPREPAPVPGGIVASGLKPKLAFELHPIRAETDAARGAALLFDVVVINNGSAPARDVLVEAQLINAGPSQDEQIGRFFRDPVGSGERLAMIPPMGRVSIKTRLTIAGDDLVPVEVAGRPLFVPLVAFNALYRWSGGEEQDSASFLVGRGDEANGKMAPFHLDLGARSWSGLGARPHSMGLQR